MGTILASAIITKARVDLFDEGAERFTNPMLLRFLNEGQRAIPTFKPNAYTKNATVSVATGTKQVLPTDAVMLIDIPRNTGGRVVRQADRKLLDAKAPNWHLADDDAEVRHFMYDVKDPKRYYCYPPNDGNGSVEMIYGAIPPEVAAVTDPISVDDIYELALKHYIVYAGYLIDNEFNADQSRADKHLQAFIAALQGQALGEAGAKPAPK